MAVEPHDGSSLPDVLVESNPASDDAIAQGDDHIRLLKIVVKNFYTQYVAAGTDFSTRLVALESYFTGSAAENALLLEGQNGAYYRNASNMNAGTLPTARLSGTYDINISGNAATATNATNATNADNATTATTASNALALGGIPASNFVDFTNTEYAYSSLASASVSGLGGAYVKLATYTLAGALATDVFMLGRVDVNCYANAGGSGEPGAALAGMKLVCKPGNQEVAISTLGTLYVGNTKLRFQVFDLIPAGTTSIEFWFNWILNLTPNATFSQLSFVARGLKA